MKHFLTFFLSAVFLVFGPSPGFASDSTFEKEVEVSLRMIGHQVLLQDGDSISRVLPVERNENTYVIRFAESFGFQPEVLAATVDSVVTTTGIASAYIVEVKACMTEEVVYSYMIGEEKDNDVIPCRSRPLPEDCYSIWLTVLGDAAGREIPVENASGEEGGASRAVLLALPFLVVIGFVFYLIRGKRMRKDGDDLITIGEFRFNPKAMTLSHKSQSIELTGKESELLYLLYTSANSTVDRDRILEKVWGDQGDYVGRTLDVFISKLRKKLEADSRVQIKNIRGVGYKLVMSAA